jgi:hypothetical protein
VQHRTHRPAWVLVFVAVVTVLALMMTACRSSAAPSTTDVVLYQATGTAKHVAITYSDKDGAPHTTKTTLPFSFTWSNAQRGSYLYIAAQIDTSPDAGSVTVTISKNGAVAYSNQAAGYPNIATATGNY